MTNLEKLIHNELLRRLLEAGWNPIDITMKETGDTITIAPQFLHEGKDVHDISYIDVNIHVKELNKDFYHFEESMPGIVHFVADYDRQRAILTDSVSDIDSYYERYIEGHTKEQLLVGNDLILKVYAYRGDHPELDWEGLLASDYVKGICEDTGRDDAKECLLFAEHWSTYSDWYKSLYWHRPSL